MDRHVAGLPRRRRRAILIGAGFGAAGLVLIALAPSFWLSAAVLATLGLAIALAPLAIAQTTASWGTGAAGEAATATLLEPLTAVGAVVLHDRRIPGSRANVDHIVICPSGVFAVETKSYTGDVGRRGDVLTVAGRRTSAVAEAWREANAVAAVVAPVVVTPLIVVHRARVGVREAGGVRVLRPAELTEHIVAQPAILTSAQVIQLADSIGRALPSAVARR